MSKKKTNEEFVEEVYNLVGDEYTPLDEYITTKIPVRMRHNTCGNVYRVKPNNFLSGKRCNKCCYKIAASYHKVYEKEFLQRMSEVLDDSYILGKYNGWSNPMEITHKCYDGTIHIWNTIPNVVYNQKIHCPRLASKLLADQQRWNTQSFKEKVKKYSEDAYEVLGEYTDSKTPILIRHKACGKEYKVFPNNFMSGKRCPNCRNNYHGELFVRNYLINHNISFISQKKFIDLYDEKQLPYDFYLPKLGILIEYQGEQHTDTSLRYFMYKYQRDYNKSLNKFAKYNLHDELKRDYAKRNGYVLVEIPYKIHTAKQINNFLDTFLHKAENP